MSLDQTFLKIFGEETAETVSAKKRSESGRTDHAESGESSLQFSLRVDPPQDSFNCEPSAPVPNPEIGAFTLAEQRRRRNPLPDFEESNPAERRTDSISPKMTHCQRPEPQASILSFPTGEPVDLSAKREQEPNPGSAVSLITSAPAVRMTEWPAGYRKIYERGFAEFAELADVVDETASTGNRILGFGGWGAHTGVSTLVIGILHEMACRGRNVLLVDANFEHPQTAGQLGLETGSGWENLLWYPENASESGLIRVDSSVSPFWFLPLTADTSEARAACREKKWFRSFLELAEPFDLVLIDHGSLRTENDRNKVFELLRFGEDGYFMVTDKRLPSAAGASEFSAVSDESRLPCYGIIENFT